MKQIFILILTFSLFSCSKDEKSNTLSSQKSEKDIFNAVIGTWNFNRLGYDPEFQRIMDYKVKECATKDYTILRNDGTITCISGCFEDEETGTFNVQVGGFYDGDTDVHIITKRSGFNFVPGWGSYAGGILYSYTDSTLVFSKVTYHSENGDIPNMYSELKRVK